MPNLHGYCYYLVVCLTLNPGTVLEELGTTSPIKTRETTLYETECLDNVFEITSRPYFKIKGKCRLRKLKSKRFIPESYLGCSRFHLHTIFDSHRLVRNKENITY